MEPIKLDSVQQFVGVAVDIVIHDEQGQDQAPSIRKTVKKVQYCPDHTHLRFYFDEVHFLAVPLTSEVTQSEQHWSAFDLESGLRYTFTKGQDFS